MSAIEYKKLLFEEILDLLWRQWTAAGIPGHVPADHSGTILDPEALLLFSAGFARYDQRLFDLILDWLQIHSAQINIQRLKAIHAKTEWADTSSLGYIAAVTAESDPARWKKTVHDFSVPCSGNPVALFRDPDDRPENFIPQRDPLAFKCGFLRNLRKPSEKIPADLPGNTASVLLRMRGVLGISARVETILILLADGPCKVQEIAARSGFVWKSIQDVLEELTAGGLVECICGNARGKQYFLKEPDKILKFFDLYSPSFAAWTEIYESIGACWQLCSNPAIAGVSEETFQNELHLLYHEKIQIKKMNSKHPVFQKSDWTLMNLPEILRTL